MERLMPEEKDDQESEQQHDPLALEKYAKNITEQARSGKLDPVIGRENEISRCIKILSRRRKNNPVLIGDPGVGKSSIVESLALRIVAGNVPSSLQGVELHALDLGQLMAGAKFKGDFEERLHAIIHLIKESDGKIICFIDEIHNLCVSGKGEGSPGAANLLKPSLARGELRCIGATTYAEYKAHIEKDAALERRFQPVYVAEPTVEESIEILNTIKEKYELHHKVSISKEAIIAAVNLSNRYITERHLPDKAIDLMDEAMASVKVELESCPKAISTLELEFKEYSLSGRNQEAEYTKTLLEDKKAMWNKELDRNSNLIQLRKELEALALEEKEAEDAGDLALTAKIRYGDKTNCQMEINKIEKDLISNPNIFLTAEVSEEDIADIVSSWTKIPVNKLMKDEMKSLLCLEDKLTQRVIAQEEAVRKVSNAVRRTRTGLADPQKPKGCFMFMGPTGTGKAQPLSSLLVSPLGWRSMGDIKIGDNLFDKNGSVTKVTGVFPQGVKPVFSVKFTDGTETHCCEDHLWVITRSDDIKKYTVKALKEFKDKIKSKNGRNLYQIPVTAPVAFETKELGLHPYLIGALLGNGGLTGGGTPKFSSLNEELLTKVTGCLPDGYHLVRYKETLDYCITKKVRGGASEVVDLLRKYELSGCSSSTKFVPKDYLYGSISQRLALLQGLMDCDGSVTSGCGTDYLSASKSLVNDVSFLVRSLGGVVTFGNSKIVDGKEYFRIYFKMDQCPYTISSKTNLWKKPTKYPCIKVIESVTLVREEECQCISVDSESHTYLTDDFIVTHNTELAKTLAIELFNSEKAIVRMDMSEFGEKHSISRLIGSPPGYVGYDAGGQLTEAVRRQPYSVLLLDEIEKAHKDIYQILLQLLDEGRLTDGQGKTVNFSNCIIIMTTNLTMESLKSTFPPEFINRIDDIVRFNPLSMETLRTIMDMQILKVTKKLAVMGINLDLSLEAKDWLIQQKDEAMQDEDESGYGARLIKRNIVKLIEDPISRKLLESKNIETIYGELLTKNSIFSRTKPEKELVFYSVIKE